MYPTLIARCLAKLFKSAIFAAILEENVTHRSNESTRVLQELQSTLFAVSGDGPSNYDSGGGDELVACSIVHSGEVEGDCQDTRSD